MKQDIIKTLKIVTVALLLTLGANYLYAWTGPSQPPPQGNVSAPLNAGVYDQVKLSGTDAGNPNDNGGLSLGVLTVRGRTLFQNQIQIQDGTQGAGEILTSDANGNASWQTPFESSFAFKRSNVVDNDSVVWCPNTHPHVISCTIVDNQAPYASNLNNLGNPCRLRAQDGSETIEILTDGECANLKVANSPNVRNGLGADDVYLEHVKKNDFVPGGGLGPIWGCMAYDSGHSHASYRIDLICAK